MFFCDVLQKMTDPDETLNKVPVELRRVTYPARSFRHGRRIVKDPGGVGFEIVREMNVSFLGMQVLERKGFKPKVIE